MSERKADALPNQCPDDDDNNQRDVFLGRRRAGCGNENDGIARNDESDEDTCFEHDSETSESDAQNWVDRADTTEKPIEKSVHD